ncbi:AAA family ATPase [Rummeliibacillus sp. POC4]|uniref:ATP-binding protein n=1 Tax=Rummeliibacillus sp. POC4 TaxID=2305899 RepID=UPI0013149750|nr:AAA family ATPase [Rummeliibacillus sp. POC4]
MYLKKLLIYGFGQHEDITVELSKGINVFYGLNEAGKTTIQQFILQILFGFPQKNHQQLRYEPKKGGKFGGQVHLSDREYGECIIERVKGKASGDVTVYLANGEKGHEELLAKILRGYNRHSFEAVFSFSVHQLQQMENLSEEELSGVLLASGTTGADQLGNVKQELEKKQQELFKKSGRVPLLNQNIIDLVQQDQKIKEERKKIDEYEPSMKRIEEIKNEIKTLDQQEQLLKQNIQKLNELRQVSPLLEEKQRLESVIASIEYTSFPNNGINRYEQLRELQLTNKASLNKVQQNYHFLIEQLREEFDSERLSSLKELVERDSEWREWQTQIRQFERDIQTVKQEMHSQFQLLGIIKSEQQQAVLQSEVSIQQEDQFQRLIQQMDEQQEQLRFQERISKRLEEEIHTLSHKLDELYESMPTEEDKERLKKWQKEKEEAAEAKVLLQHHGSKSERLVNVLSIFLAVISIILGIAQGKMILSIVGVVVAIAIYILFNRKSNASNQDKQLEQSIRKLDRVRKMAQEMEQLEQSIRLYHDRVVLVEQQLEDKEIEQKQVLKTLNKLTIFTEQSKEQLKLFLAKFQIRGDIQPKLVNELFRNVRQLQLSNNRLMMMIDQKEQLMRLTEQRLQQASIICNATCTVENLSSVVHSNYQQMLELQQSIENSLEKKKELQQQLEELILLNDTYEEEIFKLLQDANVKTIDEYYKAAEQYNEFEKTYFSLKQIEAQLQMFDKTVQTTELSIEDINYRINQYNEHEKQFQLQKNLLLKEQATLHAQAEHLLEDRQYGNHLQQFEQHKAAFNTNAREWVVSKLISTAIQETLHQLKEEKLPAVLQHAEQYFNVLTNNRYESLYLNTEGKFEVLSVEGIRYSVAELSQATKEQAYIALRFALAGSLKQSAPFPIIMDDPFVHFDRLRIIYMVQLIQRISSEHQILYFTCHDGMLEQWEKANIIQVANLNNERGLTSV